MKSLRKIMAFLIAMTMVLGMSISVFAEVPTGQTIGSGSADANGKYTISVKTGDKHEYGVYQILTGTLIAGERKLGNPKWGQDAIKPGTTEGVDAFIKSLSGTNTEIDDLVREQLSPDATGVGTVKAGTSLSVDPGYYLIRDITETLDDGDAKSLDIVAVFNNIEITPKKGTTTSEKHVDDKNDSKADDHTELKDSADYDIGDIVPYTLTATLPEDYANFKQYYISFIDDMSNGLTYNGDAQIYYGDSDTAGTAITFAESNSSKYTGGKTYTFTINDLKTGTDEQKALKAGDVITIKYTAILNDNAVVGSVGNPNVYKIEFSSNPNETGGGKPETNDTPEDVNIVFTYKTIFNKIDGEGKPLTGADFTLYKKVVENDKVTWVDVTTLNQDTHPSKGVDKLTKEGETAENAKFTFSGLDAGDYKLSETKTPDGYNTIADIEFTITAEHELVAANPELKTLTGTGGAEFTMTSNVNDGSLTANITNNQGSTLPSTGGIGTTIFYVIGGILVAGAAIILIAKKRVNG